MTSRDQLTIGLVQISSVWLDRDATVAKVAHYLTAAADAGCDLAAFGEALIPGYPFWLELTDGARFNDPAQKQMHSLYLDQGVVLERGDLEALQLVCRTRSIATYVGIMERAPDRGGHSLYCSLVFIDHHGQIKSVHRKLQPTYEERLAWAAGDGHGLVVHPVGAFTVGGLNCYENWMPLARAALHGQGEDLHVAVWPGHVRNTTDVTRFMALESRSFVMSVSGILQPSDIASGTPLRDEIVAAIPASGYFANGGSCVAGPDGTWLLEPVPHAEGLHVVVIDHARVREERQNFDLAGHYSRPDVTRLVVDRSRQAVVTFAGE
jgi:nitrilase